MKIHKLRTEKFYNIGPWLERHVGSKRSSLFAESVSDEHTRVLNRWLQVLLGEARPEARPKGRPIEPARRRIGGVVRDGGRSGVDIIKLFFLHH
jgi:hypothetical protein